MSKSLVMKVNWSKSSCESNGNIERSYIYQENQKIKISMKELIVQCMYNMCQLLLLLPLLTISVQKVPLIVEYEDTTACPLGCSSQVHKQYLSVKRSKVPYTR